MLAHQLLSIYQRCPRVVMKATLQLDPNVDIVGNRLPNVFIKHRPAGERIHTEEIGRLARGLDQNSALVIFPEGGNWPPGDGAADTAAGAPGTSGSGRTGPGNAQPAAMVVDADVDGPVAWLATGCRWPDACKAAS